ncbi:SCO1 protein [Thauera sp. GDN1]|uniref:SCO family protein n=1 Tax=Thauera sp. GDN1 TaxID=2944810 RepID=UPI00247AF01E|nr:SCO family protein [Thauera sp. GDN1]WEN41143.1 SCO1 protein [Thauera sp. GDN1]
MSSRFRTLSRFRSLSRLLAAPLLVLGLLAGCAPSEPAFKSTDITGADYGKRFELTDHHGKVRTLADFKGKVVTVFFGYTQCPDVCPTALSGMSAVMAELGADGDRVQVIFVTVDPERDTQELLAEYVPVFDQRFLGMYGSMEKIAEIAKDFRVFYRKSGDLEGHYTIDHTAGTYVFGPDGRLRLYVKHAEDPQVIAADIKALLAGK